MKEISVIIPVYNSEKYIKKTIEEILKQLSTNMEIILIDDCSSDNSLKICKEMEARDERVRVFHHEENQGICKTRNEGIRKSEGKYIIFSDDDDAWEENLIADQIKIVNENPSIELIKFGRELINIDSNDKIISRKSTKFYNEGLITEKDKYEKYFDVRKSAVLVNVWNGMYSKEVIEKYNIFFDESMKYGSEDAKFSFEFYLKSKYIFINPKTYYKHFKRNVSSTSRKFNKNKIYSIIESAKTETKIWDNINFNTEELIYNRTKAINSHLSNIMIDQVFHRDSNLKYNDRKKIYKDFIENLYINYKPKKQVYVYMLKKDLKNLIISMLISINIYPLIDVFYRISASIKNRKWG